MPTEYNITNFVHTVNGVDIRDLKLYNFSSLSFEDTGNYTCHVTNGVPDVYQSKDQTSFINVKVEGIVVVISNNIKSIMSIKRQIHNIY